MPKTRRFPLAILLVLHAACRDVPVEPNPSIDGPLFHQSGTWFDCRQGSNGVALKWVGPGSNWEGLCPVQATEIPSPFMGSSNPGTVTFEFAEPVIDILFGATYSCPGDCPTTHMSYSAYGPDGSLVAEGPFRSLYYPWSGDTVFSGPDLRGLGPIKRVVIYPPVPMFPDDSPGIAISFIFDFHVLCPPTGDAILDDPGIQEALLDELSASRPNPDGTGKKEFGGYVYQRDDGSYFLHRANDLTATDCGFTIPAGSPPTIPGATYAGRAWHTHPSFDGERVYGCPNLEPNERAYADRDPKYGGGSPKDWKGVNDFNTPMYIIDLDENVYRLDPGWTNNSQWASNPNRWRYDASQGAGMCLIR